MENDKIKEINNYIIGVKKRKEASVEGLYDVLAPKLRYIALKYLKNEQESNDIVQDFWADIYRICDSYIFVQNGFSYLCKVMTRKVINRYHELYRHNKVIVSYVDYSLIENYETTSDLDNAELRMILSVAMRQLTNQEKIIIQEIYFEGKTLRMIAKDLSLSKTRVGELKIQAKEKIKNFLTRGGQN